MSQRELKKRTRKDYGYILEYRTRWFVHTYSPFQWFETDYKALRSDNDMYDHMNNSIYNFL